MNELIIEIKQTFQKLEYHEIVNAWYERGTGDCPILS